MPLCCFLLPKLRHKSNILSLRRVIPSTGSNLIKINKNSGPLNLSGAVRILQARFNWHLTSSLINSLASRLKY